MVACCCKSGASSQVDEQGDAKRVMLPDSQDGPSRKDVLCDEHVCHCNHPDALTDAWWEGDANNGSLRNGCVGWAAGGRLRCQCGRVSLTRHTPFVGPTLRISFGTLTCLARLLRAQGCSLPGCQSGS